MALNINGTTGISGVDGSVSAPAVTGTDSNTGITFPSADTIKFSTGGVERISITNSGISGTGISAGGITMAYQWRITSDFTLSGNAQSTVLNSNWEVADSNGIGSIGTNLTESSGVFTFPSTGIYYLNCFASYKCTSGDSFYLVRIYPEVSTDSGSNFNYTVYGDSMVVGTPEHFNSMTCHTLFDVTNTSTHKFRMTVYNAQNTVKFTSSSSVSKTGFTVLRLGDT